MENTDPAAQKLEDLIKQQKDVVKNYDRVLEVLLAESKLRQTLLEYQTEAIRQLNTRSMAETAFMIAAIIITVCRICG